MYYCVKTLISRNKTEQEKLKVIWQSLVKDKTSYTSEHERH